jgi:hypothetical protein
LSGRLIDSFDVSTSDVTLVDRTDPERRSLSEISLISSPDLDSFNSLASQQFMTFEDQCSCG